MDLYQSYLNKVEINCYVRKLTPGHPGMARMKSLARSYMWWPRLDKDIENKVKNCEECQQKSKSPALV